MKRRLIVFGGSQGADAALKNNTYALQLDTLRWDSLTTSGGPPCKRRGAGAIYSYAAGSPGMFVALGEIQQQFTSTQDTWKLTLPSSGTPTWLRVAPTYSKACLCDTTAQTPCISATVVPQPKGFALGALDPGNKRMFLVGGVDMQDTGPLTELHSMSVSDTAWTLVTNGFALAGFSAGGYDSTKSRVVLFGGDISGGGQQHYGYGNVTVQVSVSGTPSWSTLSPSTSPPARVFHAGAYDPVRNKLIIFGGRDASGHPLRDTWVFDDRAPGKVTNLDDLHVGSGFTTLRWTAPDGDSSSCSITCSQYDIRYSTSPITDANFGSATAWATPPTPGTPGTQDTVKITGLSNGTEYYFALKASDAASNVSLMSNTTCSVPPHGFCEGGGNNAKLDVEQVRLAIDPMGANPSRSGLAFSFSLATSAPAHVDVFDISGRKVWEGSLQGLAPGPHPFTIPMDGAHSGFYVVRMTQGGQSVSRSAIVLR